MGQGLSNGCAMAKRIKEPVDTGEPGKFYFTPPVTLSIVSPEPRRWGHTNSRSDEDQDDDELITRIRRGHEPVNLHSYRETTNCRLVSSRNGIAHKPPEKINYLLEEYPEQQDINDYLELKRLDGFGEGAIVTRRWQPKGNHRWSQQWGTIMISHKISRGGARWAPYAVKWHMIGEIEQAWAEDLIVIHATLDADQLDAIAEAQGVSP